MRLRSLGIRFRVCQGLGTQQKSLGRDLDVAVLSFGPVVNNYKIFVLTVLSFGLRWSAVDTRAKHQSRRPKPKPQALNPKPQALNLNLNP